MLAFIILGTVTAIYRLVVGLGGTTNLSGLSRGTAITLMVYLVIRVADLYFKENIGHLLDGSVEAIFFLIEVFIGAVLPMVLLLSKRIQRSIQGILWPHVLVISGIILNRLNVLFLTETSHGGTYFPSGKEVAITIGIISLGAFLYRLALVYLPVFPHVETEP